MTRSPTASPGTERRSRPWRATRSSRGSRRGGSRSKRCSGSRPWRSDCPRALPGDDPAGDPTDHLTLEPVVAVVGEGLAWVAATLATLEGHQLLPWQGTELLHQRRHVAEEAKATAILLVVDDENGNRQLVEVHRGDGTPPVVGENRRREHEPVR